MATVNSIAELAKLVNKMAKQAMNEGNAVKNTVIETGKKHVQSDVYDVYTPDESNPRAYKRTGQLKKQWDSEETVDGIAIFSDRHDGNRYVSEIVETGQGYQYDFEYNGVERPFTKNTTDELRGSSKLTEALKKDLKSIGIDTE